MKWRVVPGVATYGAGVSIGLDVEVVRESVFHEAAAGIRDGESVAAGRRVEADPNARDRRVCLAIAEDTFTRTARRTGTSTAFSWPAFRTDAWRFLRPVGDIVGRLERERHLAGRDRRDTEAAAGRR